MSGAMPYATTREIHSSGAFAGVVSNGQKAVISFKVTVTGTSGQVCKQGNTAYVGSDVQTSGVGASDPTKGLYNAVTMDGDSDGTDNNDACTPVSGTPTFAVKKETTDGPVTLTPTQTSLTRTYTVTVMNTSTVDGTSQQVLDVPATQAGFTVTQVVVDGGAPQTAAPYVVTNGDVLALGATKAHTVVVTYAIDQAAIPADGWTNLGQCDASDNTPDTTKGVYNLVTMTGDSDGVDNNDVCTPVTGTPQFAVKKDSQPGPIVIGLNDTTVSRTYTVTVTNSGNVDGRSPAVTDTPATPAGFTLTGATVGGAPVTITNGSFQVTPAYSSPRAPRRASPSS